METHAIIFVQWRKLKEAAKHSTKENIVFSHLMDMTFGILTLEFNVILLVLPFL